MDRYTRFVATKQGMSSALRAAWAADSIPMGETKSRIVAVMARFLDAGAVDGSIRTDVTADDVTDMLVGVFLATGNAKDAARVARLLDVLADGLRPRRA